MDTYIKFKHILNFPIFGFKDPYYNTFFIDDIEIKTTEIPPSYLPQEGAKTRKGRIIKSTKNTKFKDFEYIE